MLIFSQVSLCCCTNKENSFWFWQIVVFCLYIIFLLILLVYRYCWFALLTVCSISFCALHLTWYSQWATVRYLGVRFWSVLSFLNIYSAQFAFIQLQANFYGKPHSRAAQNMSSTLFGWQVRFLSHFILWDKLASSFPKSFVYISLDSKRW